MVKLFHAWCERNKQPILEVLERVLSPAGKVLEIGSGSGQHAEFFARHLSPLQWQPSDIDEDNLASIRAWRTEAHLQNLMDPIRLDVLSTEWPIERVAGVFSANMIHIAPWECCLGLLSGAQRHVIEGGLLILYGPFQVSGAHTSQSNEDFDENLRSRDPRWGVRDLDLVREAAEGFTLEERIEMPANNQIVVFRRHSSAS
ncbi:MAG: DUF938 domain-containing protein [bacterium]|nr:DUF938 domain-containing protein [bacterium]